METAVVLINGMAFDNVTAFSYVPSTQTYSFVGNLRGSVNPKPMNLTGPWSSILYVQRDDN